MAKESSPKTTSASALSPPPSGLPALTTLNFRVTQEFHREFKIFAAQHSKTMVEVLQEAFALLKETNGRK